ncbi:MAG: 2-amino-5-chloromuconate deaminase CnbZ [Acidimicrobiales bacterium]
MNSVLNPSGGYRYIPGIPPYSAGALADDDQVIVRITLNEPTSWLDGFAVIDRVLAAEGRPAQALCAVELRCPVPHSFGGFGSFNDDYRQALDQRGILLADGTNPVARTNVAPAVAAGSEPGIETELHAFSYTVARNTQSLAGDQPRPSFVIAGAGDLLDQADLRPEAIVGGQAPWAESGPARAEAVLDEMESRLTSLDLSWNDTDSVVVYSVERIGEVMESTILPRLGAVGRNGVHWYHARPPIEGLLFEMDNRGGVVERRV